MPLDELAKDLRRGRLPAFSLVVPSLCHDMHNCSIWTGDRWLGSFARRLGELRLLRLGQPASDRLNEMIPSLGSKAVTSSEVFASAIAAPLRR